MERSYTLGEAAKILGVHPKTIQRWDREGKIRCIRTVGGRRRIPESEIKRIVGIHEERKIVGYARVSSRTQKDDLERQIEAIKSYAEENGWQVEILKDIASGLNENRKSYRKLIQMVVNGEVSRIVVAHPDRLTRFGFKTLEELFKSYGTEIVVINEKERAPQEELVEDLITIISHFAGKLYGMRSNKYRKLVDGVKKLLEDVDE